MFFLSMVVYFNKEEVAHLIKQGLGIIEMSKSLHCDYDTIKKYLIKEFPDYMNKWKKHYFDNVTFEKLCSIFCTTNEIAFFMNMSVTKLKKRCEFYYNAPYEKIYLKFITPAVISLRRKKYQLAMENGNLFALNSLLKLTDKKYLKYSDLKVTDYRQVLLEIFLNDNNNPSDRMSAYDRIMKLNEEKMNKNDDVIFVNDVLELSKPPIIEPMLEDSKKQIKESEKI